ncbi:hypothetical protein CIP107563_00144 [Corynebacterium diphtheriae]|nr:hypothetical protein CIP107563_00144 [Corynebacterium diphtheriae]
MKKFYTILHSLRFPRDDAPRTRLASKIRELELKNTKTQGRHFQEIFASCGFRVLEFEEAGKGAGGKGAPARTKHAKKPQPTHSVSWGFTCAPGGIRTPNLLIRSQIRILLYLCIL